MSTMFQHVSQEHKTLTHKEAHYKQQPVLFQAQKFHPPICSHIVFWKDYF
jgi:hypothetical protein